MDIFILRDGEQTGPFSDSNIQKLLSEGSIRNRDMAWRKGLPAWLPLSEVMNPGSQKPSEPPPAMHLSGIQAALPKEKSPTAKQKVLLKYLGIELREPSTKSDAAILISDALENPKLQSRLERWNEEKIRLHGDVFTDEIDHRKANRASAYVELCQTQGEGVVKDVTKAHCQVLVESLDKRFPAWEANQKEALWQYFLPAIAEHFPTLVEADWKSKLRFGSTPKTATKSKSRKVESSATSSTPTQNPVQAIVRGIAYGLAALGLIIGAMQFFKPGNTALDTASTVKPAAATLPPVEPPLLPPTPPLETPLIAALTPPPEPAPLPVAEIPALPEATPPPAPPAAPPMAEVAVAAPAPPTPAPVPVNAVPAGLPTLPRLDNTPAPTPPAMLAPTSPQALPTTPAASTTPKSILTLTKPVNMQLQFGKVSLPAGTRVRLLSVEAGGLKCNFNNNIILVPATSTDYDGPLLPAASALPPALTAPTAPKPPTPSSDL